MSRDHSGNHHCRGYSVQPPKSCEQESLDRLSKSNLTQRSWLAISRSQRAIPRRATLFSVFLVLLLGGLQPGPTSAQPEDKKQAVCALDNFPANNGFQTEEGRALLLDELITESLRSVGSTPGLAIGVVEKDRVIYAKGFGRLNLETCEPVTETTTFYLLSVTKSFFGLAAALLQESGAVHLDSSLADSFEGLSMHSPLNPAQISLRDLLLHSSGFHSGGINYRTAAPGNLDEADLIHLLETYARPTSTQFAYSNVGYVVAGAAFERLTGRDWRSLLEDTVFLPAGLSNTTTSILRAQQGAFAKPYALSPEGEFEARPVKTEAQMHAAGGAASTVRDLLRWVRLNLREGRLAGQQLFPKRVIRQIHSPQVQYDWSYGRYKRYAYGLGVHNADLDGHLTMHHFGGPIHVSFQPEQDRGLVVLSAGTDSTRFVHELAASIYRLMDAQAEPTPSLKATMDEVAKKLQETLERRRQQRQDLARREQPLARKASFYAGVYRNDRLGDIRLSTTPDDVLGERVFLQYGAIQQDLISLEKDTFLADLMPGGGSQVILEFRREDGEALFWGARRFDRLEGMQASETPTQTDAPNTR